MKEHSASGSVVFVIDDDASLRAALKELFQSVGLHVELFASGSAFLENRLPTATSGCLVLDVRLPGMSGLKVQEELGESQKPLTDNFRHRSWGYRQGRARHKGWRDRFSHHALPQPGSPGCGFYGTTQDQACRAKEHSNSTLRESFGSLSARERDVVARVAAGGLNKQIAADLGLSEVTVKAHRANAMRKLRAK
jgi:FixJ family two-component response regulator